MSNPSDHPDNRGPLIDVDDLREAGVEVSDDVDLPEVDEHTYVLDDDDQQECRYAHADEIRPMYIDNPVEVEPVQPDVWTLTVADDQELTFHYRGGQRYIVCFGDIDTSSGPDATRFWKSGDLVYPTDDGQNLLLNANTTPRLAGFKQWVLDELRQRSDERLEIAEIVNAFAGIISQYSGALSD